MKKNKKHTIFSSASECVGAEIYYNARESTRAALVDGNDAKFSL
jgi:hypothetical protein